MEATYSVGNDVDVFRMFDQYLYKRSENLDLSLSIPHYANGNYDMGDQTFHTPSFGDEDFDIPPINPHQHPGHASQGHPQGHPHQQHGHAQEQHHGYQQMGMMGEMNMDHAQQQYQQPQMYQMTAPQEHMNINVSASYGSPVQQSYQMTSPGHQMGGHVQHPHQSPHQHQHHQPQHGGHPGHSPHQMGHSPIQNPHGSPLLMMQPQHQQSIIGNANPNMVQYVRSPQGGSPPVQGQPHSQQAHPTAENTHHSTTSEDSDDSAPHPNLGSGDAESFLPIHYCSASRRTNAKQNTLKRPSPEPVDPVMTKAQKKPKVQKKKKKRDPNEPQKPVSAYALFFRDTQAAIKGQNPNASFGEVSKIVASMWDALDTEHKNVYKKKTEAAKKEYLKALAAYRASLVSKGAGDGEGGGMYTAGGGYGTTPNYGNPPYGSYQQSPQQQGGLPSPPMAQGQGGPQTASQPQQSPMGGGNKNINNMGMMPPMNVPQQSMNQQQGMGPGMGQGQQQMSGNNGMMHGHPQMMSHQQHMQQQQQQQSMQQGYMQHPQQVPGPQHLHLSPPLSQGSAPLNPNAPGPTGGGQQGPPNNQGGCIRHGCTNAAIANAEWEDEYCSNECVVSHCRDVFGSWVASNNSQQQNFSAVK